MVVPSTQSIVTRGLESRAGRAVRAILRRLPRRVQRLGFRALGPVAKRWPTLATLLGVDSFPPGARAPAPRAEPARPPTATTAPRPDGWLRLLRSDPDPAERARAARALGERAHLEVTTALVEALRDPSAEVAVEAAEALAHHPAAVIVPALRSVVGNADGFFNAGVRAAAIRTLSAVLPRGEGAAIADAVSDLDAEVSIAAIAGLVDRNEEASADALLAVVENPRGFYLDLTRSAAARGLRRLTPSQTIRLRAVLEGEPEGALRKILAEVLHMEEAPRGLA